MAIIGLNFNVRTIPLNDNIRKISLKIHDIEEENRKLYLTIQEKTNLANIEKIAVTELKMKKAQTINYIRINQK